MRRADRVAGRLAGRELDFLLVTDLVNVRYLTGFTGTNGLAIVGPETRRFVTDSRYVERAKAETTGFDIEPVERELREALTRGWPDGPLRLGFEDQHVSVRSHAQLRETLPERIELVAAGGVVEAERAVKEPGEVAAISPGSLTARSASTRSPAGTSSIRSGSVSRSSPWRRTDTCWSSKPSRSSPAGQPPPSASRSSRGADSRSNPDTSARARST